MKARESQSNATRHLVLVGGGHAHVAVLKHLGNMPLQGARVTLISRDSSAPYSGMLPGLIAGHYTHAEAHIELRSLCRFAGAAFHLGIAARIDVEHRRLFLDGGPSVAFDILSLNTGSTPHFGGIPGASQYALPVKPVEILLRGWEELTERITRSPGLPFRLVVVGGGAGGAELLLAVRHRLLRALEGDSMAAGNLEFHLVTASPAVLASYHPRVQRRYTRLLEQAGVRVHLRHRVLAVEPSLVRCEADRVLPFEALIWATHAAAPEWIRSSGLATDEDGFVAVNECLQSVSHPAVFAAGDVATVLNHPRPKSGVIAVRQGAPLARNLRRAWHGQRLRPFHPQRRFLSLISAGDKYAVGSRGSIVFEGRWVWRLKDWIDRRWMRAYQRLD